MSNPKIRFITVISGLLYLLAGVIGLALYSYTEKDSEDDVKDNLFWLLIIVSGVIIGVSYYILLTKVFPYNYARMWEYFKVTMPFAVVFAAMLANYGMVNFINAIANQKVIAIKGKARKYIYVKDSEESSGSYRLEIQDTVNEKKYVLELN